MDARRSARNSLVLHKAQEGVKGGTLAGGPPFAGGPRRPQPARFADARSHPTPGGGRRNVVRPAETVTAGRRGRRPLRGSAGRAACRGIYRVRDAAGEIVKTPPPATWDRRETGTGRGLAERS